MSLTYLADQSSLHRREFGGGGFVFFGGAEQSVYPPRCPVWPRAENAYNFVTVLPSVPRSRVVQTQRQHRN